MEWFFVKQIFNVSDYDNYVYDLCLNPDEAHVTTGECYHEEFFSSSNITKIQEIETFKDSKTRFCCNQHEYVFKDYCEVTKYLFWLLDSVIFWFMGCNILSTITSIALLIYFSGKRHLQQVCMCAKRFYQLYRTTRPIELPNTL